MRLKSHRLRLKICRCAANEYYLDEQINMREFEEKIRDFISQNNLSAQHFRYDQSCHSVQEAAAAAGTTPDNLVKNICLVDASGNLIVAIVSGSDRVSASRIGKALNIERPRTATADEVLQKTGFLCGGVPSFGYKATFIIDPGVMEREYVYSGGGSEFSLVRISSHELLSTSGGIVVRVRK
jgi:prolyl-tRNA editing enzyme YbaK/EbsC (Cys-tRNA(Pro) deacylase)